MVSARHSEYVKRNAKFKGVRLDHSRVRTGTDSPSLSGGKKMGTGIGSQTLAIIKAASDPVTCGNCGGTTDLMHSDRCDQLLCGKCRKLYTQVIRRIKPEARLDRWLGLRGMVVPGTLFPRED